MIRRCGKNETSLICGIINDGAQAYRGVIPADRWHEPYMEESHLVSEIDQGVQFWGLEEDESVKGVMGIQFCADVALIRHAYVRTSERQKGVGGKLLSYLLGLTSLPILVGTWAAAEWAIRFYKKYGFQLVSWDEKESLLRRYWRIPTRQIETSVVLADSKWFFSEKKR